MEVLVVNVTYRKRGVGRFHFTENDTPRNLTQVEKYIIKSSQPKKIEGGLCRREGRKEVCQRDTWERTGFVTFIRGFGCSCIYLFGFSSPFSSPFVPFFYFFVNGSFEGPNPKIYFPQKIKKKFIPLTQPPPPLPYKS